MYKYIYTDIQTQEDTQKKLEVPLVPLPFSLLRSAWDLFFGSGGHGGSLPHCHPQRPAHQLDLQARRALGDEST